MSDMNAAPRSALLAAVAIAALAGCASSRSRSSPDDAPHPVVIGRGPTTYDRRADAPTVRVWLSDRGGTYHAGDRVRALFRAEEDAYVTIVRVDTDGRLRILYPRAPYDDNWVRAGRTYRVPGASNATFTVDDPTGVGYVFAISSYQPFDFQRVSYGRHWDHRAAGDPVRGDPFLAVRRLADMISLDDRSGYATAYDEYYVGRRVAYPRYACYDCHGSNRIPVYDPYGRPCPRYRVVVYGDFDYYPYRYYPGTRVVYTPRSRYEFKEVATRSPTPGGARTGGIGRAPGTPNDAGSAGVEHRRRDGDVDLRRPNSPTADPNLGASTTSRGSAGATRPGDDVPASAASERRRPDDVDGSAAPTRAGLGTPRRDSDGTSTGPTPHVPGTPASPPAHPGDDDADRDGDERGGRRGPPPWSHADERADPDRGSSDTPGGRRREPARDDAGRDQAIGSPREQRREEREHEERARDPQSRDEGTPAQARRAEPRQERPSAAEPRRESTREAPKGERRAEERRSEPKSQSRREDRSSAGVRRRAPD